MRQNIAQRGSTSNIRKTSGKAVTIVGVIDVMVQIETSTALVTFLVANRLATYLILGFQFFDRHLKAIKPHFANVELEERWMVAILRQSSKANTDVALPEEQQFSTRKNNSSPKSKTKK